MECNRRRGPDMKREYRSGQRLGRLRKLHVGVLSLLTDHNSATVSRPHRSEVATWAIRSRECRRIVTWICGTRCAGGIRSAEEQCSKHATALSTHTGPPFDYEDHDNRARCHTGSPTHVSAEENSNLSHLAAGGIRDLCSRLPLHSVRQLSAAANDLYRPHSPTCFH